MFATVCSQAPNSAAGSILSRLGSLHAGNTTDY